MKKILCVILLVLLLALISGCSNTDTFRAEVLDVDDHEFARMSESTLLFVRSLNSVMGHPVGGSYFIYGDDSIIIYDELGNAISHVNIPVGAMVEITFNRLVAESYPAIIPGATKIRVIEHVYSELLIGAWPPMLLVNDMLYLPGTAPWYIPELCDDWSFVGEIQSLAATYNTIPTEHLQTNGGHTFMGARVYHSPYGDIRISRNRNGVYTYREIIGDSLIVIADGVKQHFISEEAHARIGELLADITW